MESNVMLSHVFRTVPIELEGIFVLPDAIVKPSNLERNVLQTTCDQQGGVTGEGQT